MLIWSLRHFVRLKGKAFLDPNTFSKEPAQIKPKKNIPLYIHIPFCQNLCYYCSFHKLSLDKKKIKQYYQDLKRELDLYKNRGFTFSQVYFGGGTPTADLPRLMDFIKYMNRYFSIKTISVETNIADITKKSVKELRSAGVNRLSIGIQSFDEMILRELGREVMRREQTKEKLSLAIGEFDTVNVDLICNLPGQSVEDFQKDIDEVIHLGVNQVTIYPLMPVVSGGKESSLFRHVDDRAEKKYYDLARSRFKKAGYKTSNVWCFSKGKKIDEYITESDEYVGMGSGAVSLFDGTLSINTFALAKYSAMIREGLFPVALQKKLSESDRSYYRLLLNMFSTSIPSCDVAFGKIFLFKLLGWITWDETRSHVTERGLYPVSVIAHEFFSSMNLLRNYCRKHRL